jgi:hypothetical protein
MECEDVDWIQLNEAPVTGPCECGNENSSAMNEWKFLGQLSDYQLRMKDCDPRSYSAISFFFHWLVMRHR